MDLQTRNTTACAQLKLEEKTAKKVNSGSGWTSVKRKRVLRGDVGGNELSHCPLFLSPLSPPSLCPVLRPLLRLAYAYKPGTIIGDGDRKSVPFLILGLSPSDHMGQFFYR